MPILETENTIHLHPDILEAHGVLDARTMSKSLALRLSQLQGGDILDLVSLANKVKNKFATATHTCTIMNAKSGACSEDCKFCAQSGQHETEIEVYPLSSEERILADAEKTVQAGVLNFGIVTSGTGYTKMDEEFQSILNAIRAIHTKYPDLNVCASLGELSEETAAALAEVKIAHYNINLQVNPARYAELVATTHSIDSRIKTIQLLQDNGIKTCVGGIIGLGETMLDRIEMAYALKDLDVDVIPLNVLIPLPGTVAENQPPVPVAEIAKTFAIYRLIHPMKIIKFAAGRETKMKDFQGLLMLSGANGLLTGGYLTTRGRETEEDQVFIQELDNF
jgi:biotin synthase